MKLRVVLALQLLTAFAALIVFIAIVAHTFWVRYSSFLPPSIPIANTSVPLVDIIFTYGALLLLLVALVFGFTFLTFDRLFIQPIIVIRKAMTAFAESQTFTPFSQASLSAKEIHELANVFVQFTDSVAQVHERDMEMSRIKSDFISTAAHQLRTPLTGIRWALEALAKEPLTDFQKTMVEDAANKSRDLVGIVGMLLDISSIESGKHKYVFESVQLAEITESVVHDFAPQAAERNVTVRVEPIDGGLHPVRADRQQIKWVLNNLIENAIRYTPAGGLVRVMYGTAADRVQVMVHDTGIGISSKDRNNIFERFYRAENAVAKENKGNGLGLYISRTIATDHGGDLNFAENSDGPGTTFTLSLPIFG